MKTFYRKALQDFTSHAPQQALSLKKDVAYVTSEPNAHGDVLVAAFGTWVSHPASNFAPPIAILADPEVDEITNHPNGMLSTLH